MPDIQALRARNLTFLKGILQRPTMFAPSGWAVEAFILHVLSEIAFIDSTASALDRELERLRDTGLWHPPNHAYGITESFLAALPDCRYGLEVEVTAVYAQVAYRLGYLPVTFRAPLPDAWSALRGAWTRTRLTPQDALSMLGPPVLQLGSPSHDLALCYGRQGDDWAALHFKTEFSSDQAVPGGEREHNEEGIVPGPVLRWIRLSSCTLERSLLITPDGLKLSRRGLAHPIIDFDRWLAGDHDPFVRLPPDAGDG